MSFIMKRVQDWWKEFCKFVSKVGIYSLIVVSSPLLLIITLLLLFYKKVVLKLTVKYFKPKLLQVLSDYDAFHATDRFWEESRASCGLILVVDGNVQLEQIRNDFFNQVVQAKPPNVIDSENSKLYPRLTQIPQSFGGYYFWRKANYFLIHEHIRPIETPVDESGLKKFAGTVLTLPFPNKRPLWEILVFSSYSYPSKNVGDSQSAKDFEANAPKYSALVVRMHQAIADTDLVAEMMGLLCKKTNYSVHSLKLPPQPDTTSSKSIGNNVAMTSKPNQNCDTGPISTKMELVTTALKKPKYFYNFVSSFATPPPIEGLTLTCDNNAIVSWNNVPENTLDKIQAGQNVTRSALTMASVIGAVTCSAVGVTDFEETPGEAGDHEKKSKVISPPVLYTIKDFPNSGSDYMFLKNYDNEGSTSLDRLQNINGQFVFSLSDKRTVEVSRFFLKFLAIFPHPVVRYVTFHRLKGPTIYFQECKTSFGEGQNHSFGRNLSKNDLMFVGEHQLLDLIPLCGLNFRHTAISVTSIKFQNTVKISLTINSSLLPSDISTLSRHSSSISAKYTVDKQTRADQIVEQVPKQLDKMFEESKDENGFVTISIV